MSSRERRIRRMRRFYLRRAISVLFLLFAIITVTRLAPESEIEQNAEAKSSLAIAPTTIAAGKDETEMDAKQLPIPEAAEAQEEEKPSRYSALDISESDIYTLACLVYHEARGECFAGQVAVIEVVLNRMLSPRFPNTVEEVVFQKYGDVWQFSPAPYLWTAKPGETQFDAVHAALTSPDCILTANTVYFSGAPYNEHISAIIGGHYFCEMVDP